jgi:hypothetical protein
MYSLSLRDDCMDAGGSVMHGAITERVGVRGSIQLNCMIFYPLILSFSRREKGLIVCTAAGVFHVRCISMARRNTFNHRVADIPASLNGTAVFLTPLIVGAMISHHAL